MPPRLREDQVQDPKVRIEIVDIFPVGKHESVQTRAGETRLARLSRRHFGKGTLLPASFTSSLTS
jgi:hypothetical protein